LDDDDDDDDDDEALIGSDADVVVSCLMFCHDERDQKIYFLHTL